MDGVGSDLNHRLENETTFMKPRVGDGQLISRKDDVSEQQDVEIEDARLVTTSALASAGCLHVHANLEELIGSSPEADLSDRIDEPSLLRRFDRFRLVETRARTELDAPRFQLRYGSSQLGDGIA